MVIFWLLPLESLFFPFEALQTYFMFVNVQSSTTIITVIIPFAQVSFSQIYTFSHIELEKTSNIRLEAYGKIMIR